jgi:hypothetical protein
LFRSSCECCRMHLAPPDFASTSTTITIQAETTPSATNLLKILCHQLSNRPPTGSENDNYLPADASPYFIFGSSAMFFSDGVFNHSKPSHVEALPLHCIHASTRLCCSSPATCPSAAIKDLEVGTLL